MATRKKKPATARGAASTAAASAAAAAAATAKAGRGDPKIVAVTGAFGSIGRRVVRRLEDDPDVDRVVCIDIRNVDAPTHPSEFFQAHPKLSAHAVDLTEAGADRELA